MVKTALLKEGDKVPNLDMINQDEEPVKFSDFKGKYIVLYFYPRDNTPGCTREACNFRDDISAIKKLGAQVIGVSTDSAQSHTKFISKYELNFPLLADKDKKISKAFGTLKITGTSARVSFLIGKNGVIKKVYDKVSPDKHSKQVIEDLKAFEV